MCTRARQLKVFMVHVDQLRAVLTGTRRVRNLPGDADIVSVQTDLFDGKRLGVLVHSAQFQSVPLGVPYPLVNAVLEMSA